jgi:hypothetical protein
MSRNGRLRQAKDLNQVAHADFAVTDQVEDAQPRRIARTPGTCDRREFWGRWARVFAYANDDSVTAGGLVNSAHALPDDFL